MMNALESTSTRPYLLRALYEWCMDNGLTPYLAVLVDGSVQVPREYVKDGEIVLNISADATSGLKMANDYIEFKARFGGIPRDIIVPVDRVMAIYARENGQGMAFPVAVEQALAGEEGDPESDGTPARPVQLVPADDPTVVSEADPEPPRPPAGPRPALKRIK